MLLNQRIARRPHPLLDAHRKYVIPSVERGIWVAAQRLIKDSGIQLWATGHRPDPSLDARDDKPYIFPYAGDAEVLTPPISSSPSILTNR